MPDVIKCQTGDTLHNRQQVHCPAPCGILVAVIPDSSGNGCTSRDLAPIGLSIQGINDHREDCMNLHNLPTRLVPDHVPGAHLYTPQACFPPAAK